MTARKRVLYRVVVDDRVVRHYQDRRAAQHRAVEVSQRAGYEGKTIRVDRSQPIEFEPTDDRGRRVIQVIDYYRDGVAL